MKNILRTFSLFALSLVAFADSISFNTLPTTQGTNGVGTYYTGYVGATVNGNFALLLCDDFGSTTNIPTGPFQYNVSTLDSLTFARFTTNALQNYRAAAILLDAYDLGFVDDPNLQDDYQFAIWGLFNSAAGNTGTSATLRSDALAQTLILPSNSGVYSQLRVYTPTTANASQQEFLGITNSTPTGSNVPEPTSCVLLGVGLLVISRLRLSR